MARVKISEFKAKKLLHQLLEIPYSGISVMSSDDASLEHLDQEKKYVIKVDQGVKKRFKRGLMGINKTPGEVREEIKRLHELGYAHFIVEEFVTYDSAHERYLSIERVREGFQVLFSVRGGVDIEETGAVHRFVLSRSDFGSRSIEIPDNVRNEFEKIGLSPLFLSNVLQCMNDCHFSFLEINPLIIHNSEFLILDLAVEADSAGGFFADGSWTEEDYRYGDVQPKTQEELSIEKLAAQSQASFKFSLINPNGSVWVLLSGGGASIAVADEVANIGHGEKLANYGEYSGNPNDQETYLYTKNLLSLLLQANSENKVLIIAGGVANFTDVKKTFLGIIRAIKEVSEKLREQHVRVYVRRGGPNQAEGLKMMEDFLQEQDVYGEVRGPEMVLTDIVQAAVDRIR